MTIPDHEQAARLVCEIRCTDPDFIKDGLANWQRALPVADKLIALIEQRELDRVIAVMGEGKP